MNDIIERSGELIVPATIVEKQLGKVWVTQTAIIQNTVHHVVPPELVRCKDCIHIKKLPIDNHGHQPYWCENLNIYTEGLAWFCADGERKKG